MTDRGRGRAEQVFLDTAGWAFSYPLARAAGCRVASYTHYPTVSADMLVQVRRSCCAALVACATAEAAPRRPYLCHLTADGPPLPQAGSARRHAALVVFSRSSPASCQDTAGRLLLQAFCKGFDALQPCCGVCSRGGAAASVSPAIFSSWCSRDSRLPGPMARDK